MLRSNFHSACYWQHRWLRSRNISYLYALSAPDQITLLKNLNVHRQKEIKG